MKRLLLSVVLAVSTCAFAQERTVVDQTTADAAIAKAETTFPKFHREFLKIKATDKLIKKIEFVRQKGMGRGPAFASPMGVIDIDISFLETPRPNFDDDRMIVVLYHELGHLHYYELTPRDAWTPENSEKAAFEYSLLKTKQLAEKGDCGPLATGVKFMKMRSEGTNLADPHVRALKRMVNEPLYAEYVSYVAQKCVVKPAAVSPPTKP